MFTGSAEFPMPHFKRWFRIAICGCALASGQGSLTVEAAQPMPPIAPYRAAPQGEMVPRPAKPAPEPTVAVKPPEPPKQRPLSALSIDIRPVGEAPPNAAAEVHYLGAPEVEPEGRGWGETLYFWQASNMAHRPLYFEQAYVERYGYNYGCLQPIASGVQFFGTVAVLPVKCAVRRPNECDWTLGYGRPGSYGVPCPRY